MNRLPIITLVTILAVCYLGCGPKEEEVINQPPSDPYDPFPADGATDVEIPVTLEWSADDPDGDALAYKVKIGEAPAEKRKRELIAENSYTLDDLKPGTTYYWSIYIEDGNGGYTEGPNVPNYWVFTTAGGAVEEEPAEGETE